MYLDDYLTADELAEANKEIRYAAHTHNRRGVDYTCWKCPYYPELPKPEHASPVNRSWIRNAINGK